jgi:hypothetical protein
MSDNAGIITASIAAILCFGMLIGGPVSCAMQDAQQITERVKAACGGDLDSPSRSSACTLALTQRPNR